MTPQITVLDAGGQYCHLIARKVRELGVYADVAPSETPASELAGRKGVIISGGPASVYDAGSPTIDPALLASGIPVLGICYGEQLIAHLLGGRVVKGDRGEYGFAELDIVEEDTLLRGVAGDRRIPQPVWMSHRDLVAEAPPGFHVLARTATCPVAAMGSDERRLYGVQFHPEVAHTPGGKTILSNFVSEICGCVPDWDPARQIQTIEDHIRAVAAGGNVFFFVSGGVDSTVAYTLCLKALGPDRVHGTYVDSGFMREGETEFVRASFARLGAQAFFVEDARERFLTALAGVVDPERKRHIIGEQFVEVQERILESEHYLDGRWILGQGTIYPDTIESGGTAKADLIKTHHNRVAGIQKLIDAGRIIEPLSSFYKDEVRAIGSQLGIAIGAARPPSVPRPRPRHPLFVLGNRGFAATRRGGLGSPHPLGRRAGRFENLPAGARARRLPGFRSRGRGADQRRADVNRVLGTAYVAAPIGDFRSHAAHLTSERLDRLRHADAIVRKLSRDSGFDREIWQFPVVLVPFGTPGGRIPSSSARRFGGRHDRARSQNARNLLRENVGTSWPPWKAWPACSTT